MVKKKIFEGFLICPKCGKANIEVILYDHAWEYIDDPDSLEDFGIFREDDRIVVYHCLTCKEDILIRRVV